MMGIKNRWRKLVGRGSGEGKLTARLTEALGVATTICAVVWFIYGAVFNAQHPQPWAGSPFTSTWTNAMVRIAMLLILCSSASLMGAFRLGGRKRRLWIWISLFDIAIIIVGSFVLIPTVLA